MQEQRFLSTAAPTATGRTISGYAARFNTRSQNLGTSAAPWFEIIAPGAFPDLNKQDVRALFNHDPNLVLARSKNGKGSLKLSIDGTGLRYEFQAPTTQAGNDLLESIRRGDIDQSSFGFTVASGGDSWKQDGNVRIRTISKIETLMDVSPCTFAAYTESTVTARKKTSPVSRAPLTVAHWNARIDLLK